MGVIWLNWKVSLRIFNENMNTKPCINMLKEKNNGMNLICRKEYILMRDKALQIWVRNNRIYKKSKG